MFSILAIEKGTVLLTRRLFFTSDFLKKENCVRFFNVIIKNMIYSEIEFYEFLDQTAQHFFNTGITLEKSTNLAYVANCFFGSI